MTTQVTADVKTLSQRNMPCLASVLSLVRSPNAPVTRETVWGREESGSGGWGWEGGGEKCMRWVAGWVGWGYSRKFIND